MRAHDKQVRVIHGGRPIDLVITHEDQQFLRKISALAEDPDGPPDVTLADAELADKQKRKSPRTRLVPTKARRLKLKMAELVKGAEAGPSPHRQFDEAFATMAYTYLQQKAPSLIDSMLGFQVLDRTDDGKRAVGVFVFNPGGRLVQAPVFFVDGELKGHQIIRLVKENLSVPLAEGILKILLRKRQAEPGEPAMPSTMQGLQAPSTEQFMDSPLQLGKYGMFNS